MKKVILLFVSLCFFACSPNKRRLPIFGSRQPIPKLENGKTVMDTIYQTIPAFSFLNQDSAWITNKDFDGKIYVADFFFTNCTSICPTMHRHLFQVYQRYRDNPAVKFLSHSIDYVHDTPSILKKYATKLGVKGTQWEFVCGQRDTVYSIAKSYLVSVAEDTQDPTNYIHQGWFILVDRDKHIRGAYDGTNAEQVKSLEKDIKTLLEESQ